MDCPRRHAAGDERCAYQIETERPAKPGGLLLGLGIILIVLAFWPIPDINHTSTVLRVSKGILAVSGLGLALIGVYRQWGRRQSARNPVTGQTWRCTNLIGIELDWVWESGFQPMAWAGSPARGLRYPASVAEFCRQGNTVDIIATALLQLVSQGILSFGKQVTRRRFGRQHIRYLVLAGDEFGVDAPLGVLESRMVEIVSTVDLRGLPLTDFLHILFEGGHPQPRNFLVDRFVGPETASLGLGKVVGVRQRALAPAPNTSARVGRDIESVEQLHRDLWTTAPHEAAELFFQMDSQILRLMRTGGLSG